MIRLALFVLLVSSVSVLAETGTLVGFVTDRESGEPLGGVTIRLSNTRLGAISKSNGRFTITDVPTGMQTAKATLVGYEPEMTEVFVKTGTTDIVMTMLQSSIRAEEVVVSAGRRIQAVQDVPISVSTLGQQDLVKRSVTQLDDALRYVSGVSLVGDQVSIRGSSGFAFGVGSRTAVLLDGFPILSGDNGDIKFDVMPVADVERVEVIKGAGSALYGTGALGGVVSMFTKTPTEELQVQGRAYAGLYTDVRHQDWQYRTTPASQWGVDARVSQKFGDWSVNASGGYRTDESYREFDRQFRGFGYGKVQWTPSDRSKVTLFSLYSHETKQNFIYWENLKNATRPDPLQDQNEWLTTSRLAAAVEYVQLFSNTTSLVIRPGVFRTRFESDTSGVVLDSNQSTAYAYNVDAILTSTFNPWLTITGGLTARANDVAADVYGQQFQTIFSGFAQGEFKLPQNIILTAGLRMDREETATLSPNLEFSPKIGASWKARPDLAVRASVGRGFRAATIAERYASIRYGPFQTKPNPDIRPESSISMEIGARYTPKDWPLPIDIDLAVFNNELYDLIEPTFDFDDPDVPIVFTNVTRARVLGSELTVRAAFSKSIGLETGLTAMIPTDLSLNEPLKYRNNILWYSRGFWSFDIGSQPFELQGEYRFVSRSENIDQRLDLFISDASQRVPSHVVDARLFWDMRSVTGQPIRLGIIAKNLLDYYYAELVANLSPTRTILLQIELQ